MSVSCTSRILKEYKTTKADCMWPETTHGPKDVGTLPVCGGVVHVKIQAVDEPDWGGHYATMKFEATCSKCKSPFWPGRIALEERITAWDGFDITDLLEGINL